MSMKVFLDTINLKDFSRADTSCAFNKQCTLTVRFLLPVQQLSVNLSFE